MQGPRGASHHSRKQVGQVDWGWKHGPYLLLAGVCRLSPGWGTSHGKQRGLFSALAEEEGEGLPLGPAESMLGNAGDTAF